ncbi:MAG: hypothetical protein MJZ19_01800 [Paludibacteraceae bacterium]|nr:hypothetical protein [Paludibacteraceae bacterium]
MKNFSFVKKLRNERHAHYMSEFLEGMPQGIYDNKKPLLTKLVANEIENLSNCRKNHTRVQWNDKVNQLRNIMAALGHILVKEAEMGRQGGDIEKHSYFSRVSNVNNNHDYVESVRAFLGAWSGVESTSAEALVDEAREICEEIENLVSFMEMEDLMIANIPPQVKLRIPTDELVDSIIKKAEVEQYELSPNIESEVERLEMITEFLGFVKNWIKRITVSVKNSGNEEDEPQPEPEVEPLLVSLKKVELLPDGADYRDISPEEDRAFDQAVEDGLYEVYP